MDTYDLGDVTVVDPDNLFTVAMKRAMNRQRYELMERKAVAATIRPEHRILELGAGCGVVSAAVAKITGPEAVVTVEANPALLPTISQVHAINGVAGIRVINAVASTAAGKMTFYLSRDFWASSLSAETTPNVADAIEVETIDVNRLIAEHGANVVIADIEGAEFEVFETIDWTGVDLVIVELHPDSGGLRAVGRLYQTLIAAGLMPDLETAMRPRVAIFRRPTDG